MASASMGRVGSSDNLQQPQFPAGDAVGLEGKQEATFSNLQPVADQPAPKTSKSFFSMRNVAIAAGVITGIILAANPATAPVIGGLLIAGGLATLGYMAMHHFQPEKMEKFESSVKEALGGMIPGQGMNPQIVKNNNENLLKESAGDFGIDKKMKDHMCGQAQELLKTRPNNFDGWASLALLLGDEPVSLQVGKENVKLNKMQAANQALANMPSKPSVAQVQLAELVRPLNQAG